MKATTPQPPKQIDPYELACDFAEEVNRTDELTSEIHHRLAALEEVAAARWPRRVLLAMRFGRAVRHQIAPYKQLYPDAEFNALRFAAICAEEFVPVSAE